MQNSTSSPGKSQLESSAGGRTYQGAQPGNSNTFQQNNQGSQSFTQ